MAIGRGVQPLESRGEAADTPLVRASLREEGGFGLIELLLALTILNIGLLAVVASFSSGIVSLNRASRVTTASILADQQMELYRAITYTSIRLASSSIPGTVPYTNDAAYSATQVTTPTCSGPPFADECNASRTVTGADKKPYRLDVFIVEQTPTGGRPVKRVTVVVRDANNVHATYARQTSTFDQSTG